VRSLRFGLTDAEYGEVRAAAAEAGMAKGAYAAQATLAVARGRLNPVDAPLRQALTELIRAAGLVRRIGVNLNQAVAKLNATGQFSADLRSYARETLRRVERLDAAAEHVRRHIR
jgi:ABC-type transporter Mla subunit MlaD